MACKGPGSTVWNYLNLFWLFQVITSNPYRDRSCLLPPKTPFSGIISRLAIDGTTSQRKNSCVFSKLKILDFGVLIMTKPRKSPVTTSKKKTTASARAKNSTRKMRNKEVNLDGSFLTASGRTTVSTGSSLSQNDGSEQPPQHDAVMAYLKKIDTTNQALLKRVDDIETQRVQAIARQGFHPNLPTDHTNVRTSTSDVITMQSVPAMSQPPHTGVMPAPSLQPQNTTRQDLPSTQSIQQNSTLHNAVILDLAALRLNPEHCNKHHVSI